MAGNKCYYVNCGRIRRDTPGLHLFEFPFRNEERCKIWLINSGNSSLHDISPVKLKNKGICQIHFEDHHFRNSLKNTLNRNAVPLPSKDIPSMHEKSPPCVSSWKVLKEVSAQASTSFSEESSSPLEVKRNDSDKKYEIEAHTLSPSEIPLNVINSPHTFTSPTLHALLNCQSPASDERKLQYKAKRTSKRNLLDDFNATPRKKTLIKLVKTQTAKVRQQNGKITYLKKKISKFGPTLPASAAAKLLADAQLTHKKRQQWSPALLNLAQSIYFASPKAYRILKKQGVILPAISTLQQKLSTLKIEPGFSAELIGNIAQNIYQKFPNEDDRVCVLLLDEMAIKKDIQYNKSEDVIEGFADMGNNIRQPQYASQAMVFMLAGLRKQWKVPLAYQFTANSMKSDNIKQAIQDCINIIRQNGLNIKVIVCDQGPTNRSAVTKLGISKERPFVTYNREKVYFMYDVPHLIKSVRNQLISHDFIFNGQLVSWSFIRQVFDIDQQGVARALPKIGDIHIQPNSFQKMKCKYAIQVFSHSMAAAIRTAISKKQLPDEAAATADFVDFMNDTFDALNSSTFRTTCRNRVPLCYQNMHIRTNLENHLLKIQELKTINLKVPPCFKGLALSIKSVLLLYDDLKSNKNFSYLMTRRLCQDPLENFFSLIRSKGGFDRNPTAKSFRLSFRQVLMAKLNIETSGNCEDDGRVLISYSTSPGTSAKLQNTESDTEVMLAQPLCDYESAKSISPTHISKKCATKVNLETCAILYTAGFIVKKCIAKYRCEKCKETNWQSTRDGEQSRTDKTKILQSGQDRKYVHTIVYSQ